MMTAEMTDFSRNWLRDSKSEKVYKLFEKRREKCQKRIRRVSGADWLHVDDHVAALRLVNEKGNSMENNNKNCILQVRDLHKSYGSGDSEVKALNGVNLDIYEGELFVILGSSGSGKSTLLNMIGGMDAPTSGSIVFRGREIGKFKDRELTNYRKNSIGFIFQSFNLIGELTVRENIALVANTKNNPNIVEDNLKLMGLLEKKNKYPSQLSGGQQQRVAIARALSGDPDLLLCDEPTGALDYETGKQILRQLEKLVREYHKTVIIVTHTKEIAQMGDRVISVKDGRITEMYENENPVSAERVNW